MSSELSPLQRAFLALEETRARLAASEARQREPIAIVGLGCRFPGAAANPDAYWALLRDGKSGISAVPSARWDHAPYVDATSARPGTSYAQHAGFIAAPVDEFDAAFFGISPREAAAMDPQQRLLLEVAWEALEHAGLAPDALAGTSTGVFVGMPSGDYMQLQLRGGTVADIDAHYASGIAHSIAAGRLSYLLGLQGPSIAIDTACSSSLVAVHLACQSLRARESDLALAAGVNLILSPESFIAFSRTHMLAADGQCKVFDDAADGFVRGEGCGVVVLKRLSDATAHGDRILAVIAGSAVNQDGASASLTAPSGPAQEAVIRRALSQAALTPADVQFVEAHGTGTSLGDPIELRALGAVYGAARSHDTALVVGSVKANVGHLEGAAGVASLIKAVLALNARHIPGQLYVSRPTTHVDWSALHLRLPAVGGEAWPAVATRRAAISAFGFSGTNAHVIVEAPPAVVAADVFDPRPVQLIPIAGKTTAAVQSLAELYAAAVSDSESLTTLAHTAAVGRAQLIGARSTVVARTPAEARALLTGIAGGDQIAAQQPGLTPRAAFLFTGQGSQSPGMGRELYESHPAFRASIDASAATLEPEWGGVTLREVLYGPNADVLLAESQYVQPALVAIELALATLWRSWGVEPVMLAGHSLGEYAAAAVAGVMSAADALRLVAIRGRLMAALPRTASAMTSVPASVDAVRAIVGSALGTTIELAADNGPSQCVLTGSDEDITSIERQLRDEGGLEPRRLLATTNAFHSRFIEPMLESFEAAASAFSFAAPQIPVSWNRGSDVLAPHQAPDARYWREQTRHAVLFGDAINDLRTRGVTHAIEIGPHPVLTGLVAGADDRTLPTGIASLRRGRSDWETLAGGVAQWWQAGGRVDWAQYNAPWPRQMVSLPTYPFDRVRHWLSHARVGAVPARRMHGHDSQTHPLVGARIVSPALDALVFESIVSPDALPLLDQHRIHGRATLPGAAWLDAMSAAGAGVLAGPCCVTGLTLHAPLQVDDAESRMVQLVLRQSGDTEYDVSAYSRTAGTTDSAWTLHARASLRPASGDRAPQHLSLPAENATLRAELYDRFASIGLTLGPEFRRIQHVARHDARAVATIAADGLPGWAHGVVHPVLIDACIQVIGLAAPVPTADAARLYMPFAVESFEWSDATPSVLICEATLRPTAAHGETIVADVIACALDGRVVGRLTGVTLKRGLPAVRSSTGASAVRDALYEVQWEPLAAAATTAAASTTPVPLTTVAARVAAQGQQRAAASSLDRYAHDGPAMDRLAGLYVWNALRSMGAPTEIGASFTADALARDLRVLPRHGPQFVRLLELLVEDDVLARLGATYVVRQPLQAETIDAAVRALRDRQTPFLGELDLMVRCGEHLAAALTGAIDPLSLLFPGGSLDDVHRIYRDSPFPRTFNALVTDALSALTGAQRADAPLRVLEVGGGTGGTTAAVLDAIPAGRCQYTFTDTSPLFLTRARERFAARSDVSYQLLDLERDAAAQGFAAASFDLIVGANVIHATRDVGATLKQLQSLLAPGGALLMLEMSRPSRWVDLSFGFTEGWWAFADAFRQQYPLIGPDVWQRVLESVGFGEIAIALGTAGAGAGLEEQAMIFARTSAPAVQTPRWILLPDTGDTAAELARCLVDRGHEVVWCEGALAPMLAARRADETIHGVIDLRALDGAVTDPAETPDHAAQLTIDALVTAQDLLLSDVATAQSVRPRLWYVTRSAVRTDTADAAPAVAASTLWGLVRSLQLEHPELAASCIDLPALAAAGTLEALADELVANRGESQVAFRHGQRLVARCDYAAVASPAFPAVYRVAPRSRGSIDALEVSAADIPTPSGGEIVIRVAATGMNFKDVLNVLGSYPGDPGAVGGECAGRVVAVGHDVTAHRVGDEVVALAPASMGSHAVTHAALAAAVPRGVSLDAAAALPIAYLTAYHTLIELGKLQPGERVLIHAGAGGVGMAAIRLAQRVGAEIFATAGSEAKREYLRRLGVPHVLDSRSLSFADEVLVRTNGEGVHVTLNSLADAFLERSLAVTAHGGRFLEIGKRGIWTPEQVGALGRNLQYHLVDWTDLARTDPTRVGAALRQLLDDVASGALPLLPVEVFPLARLHDAFRHMAQGRHTGKIVVSHRDALDAMGAGPVTMVPGAAYVIAGGTSGIGLLTAEWLADRGATHLVLCSRHGGSDETSALASRLSARGVRVDVYAVDVADRDAVSAMLHQVRAVAPIRGVFQSAGQLDDGAVLQLDAARVRRVFGAKVSGTWNLHWLTLDDPLDIFVGYASVAGFLGSAGQANHAAANAFMDALAHHRRASGRVGVSIDWGAWSDVGAAVRHGVLARAAGVGVRSIAPADGLAMLAEVLSGSAAQIAAVPIDWPTFIATQPRGVPPFLSRMVRRIAPVLAAPQPKKATAVRDGSDIVVQLRDAVAARRPALMRTFLRARVARTLGLADGQGVEDRQPLRDAGLDSLLAIELRNALGTTFDRALPATLLFDYPTVDDLATHLLALLYPASATAAPADAGAPAEENAASLVSDVADLSDDEVDRLLAAKRKARG